MNNKSTGGNISYPSSAAAVVFGVYLSAQAAFRLDPDTSGQSAPAFSFLRYAKLKKGKSVIVLNLK